VIKEAIVKLSKGENLSYEMAEAVMDEIMSGEASQVQMSAFLVAMSMKGETIEEITACAAGMRKHCVKLLHDMDVLEIVGTGGDGANSFNISTTSSLVISAAGVPVAKHGNRAASSKCGAADVLEALGVNITVPPERSTELLEKNQFVLLVCAELSHCDEVCGAGSPGAVHSHDLQYFGAFGQSGWCEYAAAGRL